MGRQVGRASPWCTCVVCIAWQGFREIKNHLNDAAYAIGVMDELLQDRFSDKEMARLRHLAVATMHGLEDASDAAHVLELRLGQYAGGCLTYGVKTLAYPEIQRLVPRYN